MKIIRKNIWNILFKMKKKGEKELGAVGELAIPERPHQS